MYCLLVAVEGWKHGREPHERDILVPCAVCCVGRSTGCPTICRPGRHNASVHVLTQSAALGHGTH